MARYLGGSELDADGRLTPRPVTIVDAGLRKDLDLHVVSPVEEFGPLPERIGLAVDLSAARRADRASTARRSSSPTTAAPSNGSRRSSTSGASDGDSPLARTAARHHGSVVAGGAAGDRGGAEGRPAARRGGDGVAGTGHRHGRRRSGLPGRVAGQRGAGACSASAGPGTSSARQSKGRLIPKTPADLLEQAVLAREMAAGRVEAIRVPINCLDVLAQQLVAMAAMETWDVPELYALVRRAYPYRDLSPQAFETTLEMVSGRYRLRRRPPGTETPQPLADGRLAASAAAARQLGPRPQPPARPARQPADWPWSTAAPSPTPASTPPTPATASASANWTRSSSTSAASATCSCWAPTPGGWTASRPTACWSVRRRRRRRWCRSGAARSVGRSYDLGRAIGGFLRESAGAPRRRRIVSTGCSASYFLDANAARNLRHHVSRQLLVDRLPADRSHAVSSRRRAISSATGR